VSERIKKVVPYAVLGLVLAVLIVLNVFFHDNWLDSDMAAEMIFSKLLSEEGHLFATDSWYYSTEFRVIYTQLIMVPLFKFTGNFHFIRAVTNIITYLLVLASYFYMMKPFKTKKNTTIVTSAILLLPFSETMMTHMQMGNTYMVHVIIVMFFFGMFLRLAGFKEEHENENFYAKGDTPDSNIKHAGRISLLVVYLLTGIICGMSGVRYLLALQCPLLIASGIYLIKSQEFSILRKSTGETFMENVTYIQESNECFANFIKSSRASYFYYSLAGVAASVAGYAINIFYISKKYVFQTYGDINFISIYQGVLNERLQDAFGSLLMLFGYIPDRAVMSLRGIVSLSAFAILVVDAYIVFRAFKKCDGIRWFMALFSVTTYCLNTFVFVFTTSTLVPRYYITVFIFMIPMIVFYFESREYRLDRLMVTVALAVLLLLGTAKTTFSFITVDKNEGRREVAEYLAENGYDFGYATYWNANIITELTDAKVEVANILDPESLSFFTWSTPEKYYEDGYSDGKVFMLLTEEEASQYADCASIQGGEKVFEDAGYIVYAYDSAEELLQFGSGEVKEFR
jgi:hypothetical protein